ncbi:MAG: MarR family transcriptional regulator [Melioribacteraceae bacterium]|nr:MarR family transcriptional regulator [Melioribacteraceae bacterium]MCF8263274.1 MarR family transcriptional regulator [Melioribacteraceae bacterium]MCF8412984.1 MarR family transcriptional regulator [Melioribacteraceae bacterium]MCF8430714.1 MarR family transcriptional regulator [Melioribacteraceae bacterium]
MAETKAKVALDLWDKLSKAYDNLRKSQAKYTSSHKLTAPQFNVLEVLVASGAVPLKRISEELMVTGANITCVVDNLEKEGLVKRVPSKEDRRVIMAELTAKGKDKMSKIYPTYAKNMRDVTSVLTDAEQKQLTQTLEKLAQ